MHFPGRGLCRVRRGSRGIIPFGLGIGFGNVHFNIGIGSDVDVSIGVMNEAGDEVGFVAARRGIDDTELLPGGASCQEGAFRNSVKLNARLSAFDNTSVVDGGRGGRLKRAYQ